MEPDLNQRIGALEQKIDAMYVSVEKLRKYFLWTGIITVALIVFPLIGLAFVVPSFINSYTQIGNFDQSNSQADTLKSLLQ